MTNERCDCYPGSFSPLVRTLFHGSFEDWCPKRWASKWTKRVQSNQADALQDTILLHQNYPGNEWWIKLISKWKNTPCVYGIHVPDVLRQSCIFDSGRGTESKKCCLAGSCLRYLRPIGPIINIDETPEDIVFENLCFWSCTKRCKVKHPDAC